MAGDDGTWRNYNVGLLVVHLTMYCNTPQHQSGSESSGSELRRRDESGADNA